MAHPDKIADRIAGAMVDLAYSKEENPKIAVEVLIGHGKCHIIAETSARLKKSEIKAIVKRIAGNVRVDFVQVPQDVHLAANQNSKIRCGDNGIFKGIPLTEEQKKLSKIARDIYDKYPYDGRYVLDGLGFTNVKYFAFEIEQSAIKVSTTNYPDIVQMGDAFAVREDDWLDKIMGETQ